MKIRILGNSLRFRLKQPEVSHFQQHGIITEIIEFGPDPTNQLCFTLEITTKSEFAVDYALGQVTIHVPGHVAEDWSNNDQVGFNAKVNTGKGRGIELLVEKDFLCLDRGEEENKGAYPNPNAAC
ncbi:DUF7009 family protein [Pontibacter toksunensis]|uniref:DUF7009 family protein n=1 Tax=Pontibacter toksunensis TaxID=1332631 RepID=A0ABW6BNR7_9BACT